MWFVKSERKDITMKKEFLRSIILFTLLAGNLAAATISIDPISGIVSGSPGDVVGWGFNAYNTDLLQSISFSQSVLINETNPLLGIYTDLIGPQGGPITSRSIQIQHGRRALTSGINSGSEIL